MRVVTCVAGQPDFFPTNHFAQTKNQKSYQRGCTAHFRLEKDAEKVLAGWFPFTYARGSLPESVDADACRRKSFASRMLGHIIVAWKALK